MNLIDKMINAADTGHASYMSYLKARSSHPDKWLFVFEGYEDVPYYQAQITIIDTSFYFFPLVVKGKSNVLDVRKLAQQKIGVKDTKVSFFIDHDFDATRNHSYGNDLYVTPSYSIENLCCTDLVFQKILEGEFKMDLEESIADSAELLNLFQARRNELIQSLIDTHSILYQSRTTGIPKMGKINNQINNYVNLTLEKITSKADRNEICRLLGMNETASDADFENEKKEFLKLDQLLYVRGKFLYAFFIEFLKKLKLDRCSKNPTYFSNKRSISFTPDAEQIRVFASCAVPTHCLRSFIGRLSSQASLIDSNVQIPVC